MTYQHLAVPAFHSKSYVCHLHSMAANVCFASPFTVLTSAIADAASLVHGSTLVRVHFLRRYLLVSALMCVCRSLGHVHLSLVLEYIICLHPL